MWRLLALTIVPSLLCVCGGSRISRASRRDGAAVFLGRADHTRRLSSSLSRAGTCSFNVFDEGSMGKKEQVDGTNTEFQQNGVLVVRDGNYRILVFRREGHEGEEPYCHEQAEVLCEAPSQGGVDTGALLQQSPATACGGQLQCRPNTVPNLSYIRSMIGGAIVARGGPDHVKRVVSIGLGAGAIPLWFQSALPKVEVDTVDINGDVIAAAPCFGVHTSDTIKLIHADGRKYLESLPDQSVDILFLDAFDDRDYVPPCLQTVEFFQTCQRKLAPGGNMAMNVWHREHARITQSASQAFPRLSLGTSPGLGNLVLLGHASAPEGDKDSAAGDGPKGVWSMLQGTLSVVEEWHDDADFHSESPEEANQDENSEAHGALFDDQGCPS